MFDKLKMQIKPTLNGVGIAFSLAISAFMLVMMLLGNGKLSIELILFCTLVCVALTKAGEFSLRACHLTKIKAWLPTAFVVGFVVISLPMMALTCIFKISVMASFWISALSVLSLTIYVSRDTTTPPSIDWADIAIALVLAIAIGFLVKIPVSSPTILFNTGLLPVWSDYILHGVTIASFGSPLTFGGDMELAGVSRPFYHYVPFMIPAVFQAVSGMSGFAISTSLLLPLGLLIAAFGVYAFSVELGGRLSGLLVLTVIIAMPTSLVYFIRSGWFDSYWMMFAAPGTNYALGVSMAVCALTVAYLKNNETGILWFTLLLLFSLILIKVQLFMLLAPAVLLLLLLHHLRANIRMFLGAGVCALLIMIMTLHLSTHLHTLWMEYANPEGYINLAFNWMPISIYGHQIKIPEYPFGLTMIAQLAIILAAVLGIYFGLYPLLLLRNVRRFGFQAADALPLLLVICFIGLMFFAPIARNGDLSEYKHRHFPLIYVVIVIYTITYAFALASSRKFLERKSSQLVQGVVGSIFAATILLSWGINRAHPYVDEAMPWARNMETVQVAPGLLDVAQYMARHARVGDVLAMEGSASKTSGRNIPIDVIVSLTGIPAYIARADLKIKSTQCVQEITMKRLSVLADLSSMGNWPDAKKYLQTNGIRWFLVPSTEKNKWDINQEFATFSIHGYSVYDAGSSAGEVFNKLQC